MEVKEKVKKKQLSVKASETGSYGPEYDLTNIHEIKNRILDNYTGSVIPVRRVHGRAVLKSNVTPSFRSIWSVFGDISGMGGIEKPGDYWRTLSRING